MSSTTYRRLVNCITSFSIIKMLKMSPLLFLLLFTFHWTPQVNARSSGAPEIACSSLIPSHNADPQRYFNAPYTLSVNRVSGRLFNVSIISKRDPFKGFIVQARDYHDPDNLIVDGSFTPNLFTRVIHCKSKLPNTLTHNSAMDKYYMSVLWRPSQSFRQGKLIFRGTVVLNMKTFWMIDSNAIEIGLHETDEDGHVTSANLHQPDASSLKTVKPEYFQCTQHTHLCLGLPAGCVTSQNCRILLKSSSISGRFSFELITPSDSSTTPSFDARYSSIGFSTDSLMGDDLVFDCIKMRNDLSPKLKLSYNERDNNVNTHLSDQLMHRIVRGIRTGFVENRMYCRWEMDYDFTVRGRNYNLWNDYYHVLMARGSLSGDSDLKEHHDEALASERIQLKDVGVKKGRRVVKGLVKLHGSFMVIVWLLSAPIAIMIARNFKHSWETQFCGTKLWFALHRGMMLFNVGLVIISMISIFVSVNGWRAHNLHPYFGAASTLFMFQQPLNALFRCAPDDEDRWIFNKIHWLFGNMGHILAIVAMFFASELNAADLPSAFNWLLCGFVLFHVANQLFFSCLSWHFEKQAQEEIQMRDMDMPRSHIVKENKGSSVKNFMFSMYVLVLSVFALAFVLMISLDRNNI